jgi:hypothetical protein
MDFIVEKEKNKKQNKRYFTQETENAIIRYNLETNPIVKNEIYHEKIHYAFYKLTQNIIHTFKFYYTEVENLEDLQHEIITFLLNKIHLFDASKGAKAYSYFGTIVKRYLILSNQNNYNKKIHTMDISSVSNYLDIDTDSPDFITPNKVNYDIDIFIDDEEIYDVDDLTLQGYKYKDKLSVFMDNYIKYCNDNLNIIFPKSYDAKVADAILEIFRKRNVIDIFNKKALYIYIREIIEVKTPKITKISNQLYSIFKDKYKFYLENGYFQY